MKIYFLSTDPQVNAQNHSNKHVAGMIGVYVQLLSNALHVSADADKLPGSVKSSIDLIMAPQQEDHPVSLWTMESLNNFMYLWMLSDQLRIEYQHRFNETIERPFEILAWISKNIKKIEKGFPRVGFTPHPVKVPKENHYEGYSGDGYFRLGDQTDPKRSNEMLVRYFQDEYKKEMSKLGDIEKQYKRRAVPKFLQFLKPIVIKSESEVIYD